MLLHAYQRLMTVSLCQTGSCYSAWPSEPCCQQHIGNTGSFALFVLNKFKYPKPVVDDFIGGPNQFLKFLLYTEDSIFGGLITGIYPHVNLELIPIGADMWSLPTSDIRIVPTQQTVHGKARPTHLQQCAQSQSCMTSGVKSAMRALRKYNVLMSQAT